MRYTLKASKLPANVQSNDLDTDMFGSVYHVFTNKSILRFEYLFVEKIVDTKYM